MSFGMGFRGIELKVDEYDDILTIRITREEIRVTGSSGGAMSYKPQTDKDHAAIIRFSDTKEDRHKKYVLKYKGQMYVARKEKKGGIIDGLVFTQDFSKAQIFEAREAERVLIDFSDRELTKIPV